MTQISLLDVGVVYENEMIALENINLQIQKGEFVFLTGRNGAGKSTLLKVINGRLTPSSGEVWVEDTDITRLKGNRKQLFRRRFGLMEREIGLLPNRSVYENLSIAAHAVGFRENRFRKDVPKLLSRLGISDCLHKQVSALSGGEEARALLARALCVRPDILVADEPTANLDGDSAWDLMCLLEELNRKDGITVLIATHDRESVTLMRKRVITMAAGRIVADERQAVYNSRAADIFEERRILNERAERKVL